MHMYTHIVHVYPAVLHVDTMAPDSGYARRGERNPDQRLVRLIKCRSRRLLSRQISTSVYTPLDHKYSKLLHKVVLYAARNGGGVAGGSAT